MTQHPSGVVGWDPVEPSTISRSVLDNLATELRRQADASKAVAVHADAVGDNAGAVRAAGCVQGLMEAHGLIMAILTARQPSISVGDEVRFLWPSQATPALTNIDSHYDVMAVKNGMVAVKRTIYRPRGEMRGAWHWAPLTAVEHCTDGHRCPDTNPVIAAMEGGA